MATTEQLEARLSEAEDAFHKLSLGTSVVEIRDSNGESVRYTSTDKSTLASYIGSLKAQLGLTNARYGNVWMR